SKFTGRFEHFSRRNRSLQAGSNTFHAGIEVCRPDRTLFMPESKFTGRFEHFSRRNRSLQAGSNTFHAGIEVCGPD
ncbi:hypothetical protein, partial [Peribacillus huizhouensis]|uniref:hypothetical protein n=1 Tax=Peribacillus huizhouensis TaxID=1501239 RepID=UPI001C721CB7